MGYNWQYLQIIGYIKQKLRDIFGKIMGYIWQKLWDIFAKPWDIFAKSMGYIRKNHRVYSAKAMGCIALKL